MFPLCLRPMCAGCIISHKACCRWGIFAKLAQNEVSCAFFGHFIHRIVEVALTIGWETLFIIPNKLRRKPGFPVFRV